MKDTEQTSPAAQGHYTLNRRNAGGAPAPRESAEAALERLRALAYRAAVRMEQILKDPGMPDSAKIPVIRMVLDRIYGQPEELLSIRDSEREIGESDARIRAIAERIRARGAAETKELGNLGTQGA